MPQAMTNDWCKILGIEPPRLEAAKDASDANTYSLFLVVLLERGEPMTLAEVAARFEEAGIAERSRALLSLQRCKPARPPAYREGERYHLDPYDDELDLWAFRLGLRPPRVSRPEPEPPPPAPLPGPEVALRTEELDEAWTGETLSNWSAQRLALAVLEAHGGPLSPAEVVDAILKRTTTFWLDEDPAKFKRRGSKVEVLEDGRWAIALDAEATLRKVRSTVRERITVLRRYARYRSTSEESAARWREIEKRQEEHAAKLGRLSRALLVAYPVEQPQAVALLDVAERQITTFANDQFDELRARLATYEVLGAVEIRPLLRALDFDPGARRLAELGPPQKTRQLNRRSRTLKITTELLVQGSCGITRPFGDPEKLTAYLAKGEWTKLRRRLEADAKSLFALYEYGRLHGAVRLRWGFVDEFLPVPWVHRDEQTLRDLTKAALAQGLPLEVVVGRAPGWEDPWARARPAFVVEERGGWRRFLVHAEGYLFDEGDIQRARLAAASR